MSSHEEQKMTPSLISLFTNNDVNDVELLENHAKQSPEFLCHIVLGLTLLVH